MNRSLIVKAAFFFLFFSTAAHAEEDEQHVHRVEGRRGHEAFMTVISPYPLLRASPQPPPPPLNENSPEKTDPETIWVPGYWDWVENYNDFIWCSGTWRRPPPGHIWIQGYWKLVDNVWVRLPGFWSPEHATDLKYIAQPPPEPFNENPHSTTQDNFWMPGYWRYEANVFTWYSGQWSPYNSNWIYVPACYIWRPQGYVFIPPHWDWPIELRGTSFTSVFIPKDQRQTLVLTPNYPLEPIELVKKCFLYYPDYYYFFCHHFHFHADWWWPTGETPPWWAWNWWWLTWQNHWALWWWWSHPGYPAPSWLPQEAFALFYDSSPDVRAAIKFILPPLIVTEKGVVDPRLLLNGLGEKASPILPAHPQAIQEKAAASLPTATNQRPEGEKVSLRAFRKKQLPLPQTTASPPSHAKVGWQPSIPETKVINPQQNTQPLFSKEPFK